MGVRRLVIVPATVLALGLLGACTASSAPLARAITPPAGATVPGTGPGSVLYRRPYSGIQTPAVPVVTTRPTGSATGPLAGSEPACRVSQLQLTSDPGGWHGNYSASNMFREPFTFTNISKVACELSGWPGLEATIAGYPEQTEATRVQRTCEPILRGRQSGLAPGGTATFDVYGEDWDAVHDRTCPETSGFLVIPPNDLTQLSVTAEVPDCPPQFDVSPVIAGSIDDFAPSADVG